MTHEQGQPKEPPFGRLIGRATKITRVESKPFLAELAPEYIRQLEVHGCTVQQGEPHWTITFPVGTTRQEIFPRAMEARFELRFADGYSLYEVMKRDGLSYLFFPEEALSTEFLEQHAELLRELRGEDEQPS